MSKTLSEAVQAIAKTLNERIEAYKEELLELRKAETAKAFELPTLPGATKSELSKMGGRGTVATGGPGMDVDGDGGMAMSEMCKSCGKSPCVCASMKKTNHIVAVRMLANKLKAKNAAAPKPETKPAPAPEPKMEKSEEAPKKAVCAGCGETYPCSDSKRKDISGAERAKHYVKKAELAKSTNPVIAARMAANKAKAKAAPAPVGETLKPNAPSVHLAGVGTKIPAPAKVQTMVERVASRMPSKLPKVGMAKSLKKDLTWDPGSKPTGAMPTPNFGDGPGVASLNPGKAKLQNLPKMKLPKAKVAVAKSEKAKK